ncbi:MAG TPA: cupin domain-containing protein [Xanthobacteraceae bacterium]|nr:cupin domain-containing protein [Xanthobacteraceae bacterium]
MTFKSWHSRGDEPPIRVPAIGLELTVRLPPHETGGALAVIDTINAPGFGPPLHRHPEVEIFRVLTGRYLFEIDGRQFFADAGDVVSVPGGAAHAFVNVTDEPARQTATIIPGLDAAAFFTALGELMKDGIPAKDALDNFGRLWRVEFLGPPLAR